MMLRDCIHFVAIYLSKWVLGAKKRTSVVFYSSRCRIPYREKETRKEKRQERREELYGWHPPPLVLHPRRKRGEKEENRPGDFHASSSIAGVGGGERPRF